jgi:hypothetical protein
MFGVGRVGSWVGIAAPVAVPATPPTTNMVLHVKADDGVYTDTGRTTPATLDGDTIAGWADFSGQNNHGSQGTAASRPTLKLNQINGEPSLRFDGTADHISIPNHTSMKPQTSDAWTVAFVAKRTGAMAGNYGIIIGSRDYSGPTDQGWGLAYDGSAGKMSTHCYGTVTGHSITDSTTHSTSAMSTSWQSWMLEESNLNNNLLWYLNGTLDKTQAISQYTDCTNTLATTIGGHPSFLRFEGDIAEVAIWKGALTANEKTQWNDYIEEKYGL